MGGWNLEKKMWVFFMFDFNDKYFVLRVVYLDEGLKNEFLLSGILKIKKEYLSWFIKGGEYFLRFSIEFLVEKI